jgi:flagellar motor switch protein FliN
MRTELQTLLRLEVPLVVVLGERNMRVREVQDFIPGTIIELPKSADSDLEIRVNNRPIGSGTAVKIGENFGVRVSFVGDPATRIAAMSSEVAPAAGGGDDMVDGMSAEDLAMAMLAGQ